SVITLVQEAQWRGLCEALCQPQWLSDPRFATFARRADHARELRAAVAGLSRADDCTAWLARSGAAGVLASPVQTLAERMDDPHEQTVNAAPAVDFGTEAAIRLPALPATQAAPSEPHRWPSLGEHGRAILGEAGLCVHDVDALVTEGVLLDPAGPRPVEDTRP